MTTVGSLVAFEFAVDDPDTGVSVVVEDDGRVCYAYYLSSGGQIVGDLWLYNRCDAPTEPEWTNRSGAPYANPRGYAVSPVNFSLPAHAHDVDVRWLRIGQELVAEILVGELVIGRLGAGQKPGWARAAAKDGPLAKVLPTWNPTTQS